MSNFKKYQHVEKFGTSEVDGIEYGECFIFPKIDGTNASVWLEDEVVQAGSRRRHLVEGEDDNAGFREWATQDDAIKSYLAEFSDHRLYGEWLVPHSLKTYREDAWRKFYVFDIMRDDDTYVPYHEYKESLEKHGLEYIAPLAEGKNLSVENLNKFMESNDYLIETGKGVGEGIVIKNYSFVNRFGRVVWAKMVRSEFKEKNRKAMGAPVVKEKNAVEATIAVDYITEAMVDKVHANIENDVGWGSRQIPRLLNTVYYDLIREESWNFVKSMKNPRIDFKRLMGFCFQRVKELRPELF